MHHMDAGLQLHGFAVISGRLIGRKTKRILGDGGESGCIGLLVSELDGVE